MWKNSSTAQAQEVDTIILDGSIIWEKPSTPVVGTRTNRLSHSTIPNTYDIGNPTAFTNPISLYSFDEDFTTIFVQNSLGAESRTSLIPDAQAWNDGYVFSSSDPSVVSFTADANNRITVNFHKAGSADITLYHPGNSNFAPGGKSGQTITVEYNFPAPVGGTRTHRLTHSTIPDMYDIGNPTINFPNPIFLYSFDEDIAFIFVQYDSVGAESRTSLIPDAQAWNDGYVFSSSDPSVVSFTADANNRITVNFHKAGSADITLYHPGNSNFASATTVQSVIVIDSSANTPPVITLIGSSEVNITQNS